MQKQDEVGKVSVEVLQFVETHFRGLQRIHVGDADHLAAQGAVVASAYAQGQSDAYLSAANQITAALLDAERKGDAESE